jgi:hypothetical protein
LMVVWMMPASIGVILFLTWLRMVIEKEGLWWSSFFYLYACKICLFFGIYYMLSLQNQRGDFMCRTLQSKNIESVLKHIEEGREVRHLTLHKGIYCYEVYSPTFKKTNKRSDQNGNNK